MNNIKFIAFITILISLLIVIPTTFAVDNETVVGISDDNGLSDNNGEILTDDYYFDSSVENDTGNGSADNPYKNLNPSRIQPNSVLHFNNGEYDFNNKANINNVTIIGTSPADTIIKNAVFSISTSLILCNVTFYDSSFSVQKNFTAINCIFKESSSKMYGGVITSYNQNSVNITLENSTFSNNNAVCGGAIYLHNSILNIRNCVFLNNYASLFGGAIAATNSILNLTNVTSRNNKAEVDGGVIYTMYGDFEIHDSRFINNTACNGAGLFIDGVDYNIIVNNTFINNTALNRASLYSFYNFNSTIENNTYSSEDDFYETYEINMFISDGDYTLYYANYPEINEIPSRYNLADLGYVTPVKSQGSNGNCWAFATLATLESNILKNFGEEFDFSESNMKNLFSRYSDYGWTYETNDGGIASMGYEYLISWLGPVLDVDDPYNLNSIFSKRLNSLMHVQNVLFIQRTNFTDNDEIKKIIMTYGAVYSQIYATHNLYQYYNQGNNANHAITIVGWDDNLEFSGAPGKGGWIYKNSWGSSSGDKGYYYVSYYDTSCLPIGKIDAAFTFILNDTIKFDKNYQYDIQGKSDFFLNSSNTVWYKNIFKATDNEYLAAVSTFFEKESNYTFSIYVNNQFKISQSGFTKPGYFTFNLNEFIPLNVGDTFEIVFNITVDGDAGVPVSEKVSFNKCYYKESTSFISYDGNTWMDLYDLKWNYTTHHYDSSVACIKAFTVYDTLNTTTKLTVNITGCFIVKAQVLNQYNLPVTGGNVTFNINGEIYQIPVVNGYAILNIYDSPKSYDITADYKNTGYNPSNDNIVYTTYIINTTVTLNIDKYNPVNITAFVVDQYGNPVEFGEVIFTIENTQYSTEVINGTAKISHMFKNCGLNTIKIVYKEAYLYNSSSTILDINVQSTIISDFEIKTIDSIYQFKLIDSYGNPLNRTDVNITLNSKIYRLVTDENGIAHLIIDLTPGSYNMIIINPVSGEVKTQNIDVVARICENKDLTMYYGAGKYYKIKVLDDDGNIAKGVKVKFILNGKSYSRTTDSNGYASIKISLKIGKYNVSAQYGSFKVSNKITIKATIITKNKVVKKGKTIKFIAKLVNKNGKKLKNKKITFKFKGKTYKVKTNKKGKAILKITKKYNVGKYKIISKYGKVKVKNTIKIKK